MSNYTVIFKFWLRYTVMTPNYQNNLIMKWKTGSGYLFNNFIRHNMDKHGPKWVYDIRWMSWRVHVFIPRETGGYRFRLVRPSVSPWGWIFCGHHISINGSALRLIRSFYLAIKDRRCATSGFQFDQAKIVRFTAPWK